jgi:hypothetical protein
VKVTQKAIRHVLRERWYAWEDARKVYEAGFRPQLGKGEFVEEADAKADQ